ncbi:ATP-dependent Clp protease proteolytic subunit [Erythrobacter sp. YJ-T3-07]|uniref:ATP-dependent Clp protease proteolytic subunit n=1 Tax=Erythrobacter sp. YJ-T3-07 TaxID=2793063 RepID=UPI0018D4B1F6|nr:ATP-dependent Clp protease proteolytic subunit [Erythrobacter sp. YJ-T3-07]MBH1943762.1 ATP-dependent Clp protease proteolytic subunit [Erythrobacter sp. YJ-T3-07]
MDFIRNLITLIQRLQTIVRDGQKRGDLPGMAMALVREVTGNGGEEDGEASGPAIYQGKRAQADQGTPERASRATARNRAARDTDLPEPAVYRRPEGSSDTPDFEPARVPARNAGEADEQFPQPAAAPLQKEDYDYQPASAPPEDTAIEPKYKPARASAPEPEPEEAMELSAAAVTWDDDAQPEPPPPAPSPEPQEAVPAEAVAASATPVPAAAKEDDDEWFDLEDWQGTALKVAGVGAAAAATAAGAMAIKDRFFDRDDEEGGDKDGGEEHRIGAAENHSAIPLPSGDEPLVQDAPDGDAEQRSEDENDGDENGGREWAAAAAVAAPAVAAVLPKASSEQEPREDETSATESEQPSPPPPEPQPETRQQVEIIPADPRNPATQPPSQSLASPGIRLYGTMDAAMYAEFSEMLSEQAPGGPIVIALTTMDGDPEIARSMAEDIRLLRDRGRREIIFLGKTAVYSAGVLFMAAFPVGQRYLTRATKLLITENKRAQPIQLAGGSLRSVASQLEHARREIQREIDQEDDDFRAISEGSNVSVQELREKAPGDWYITASEAKAMGLIAEVV